jgi:hypothetical protein
VPRRNGNEILITSDVHVKRQERELLRHFKNILKSGPKCLGILAPRLEEVEYKRSAHEPKHRAQATFVVDETEFKANFTMREVPDRALAQPYVPAQPTYVFTVYLLKDSSERSLLHQFRRLGKH